MGQSRYKNNSMYSLANISKFWGDCVDYTFDHNHHFYDFIYQEILHNLNVEESIYTLKKDTINNGSKGLYLLKRKK